MTAALHSRLAKLEMERGGGHSRFIIVNGVEGDREARAELAARGIRTRSTDMVDWLAGPAPVTIEVVPATMSHDDIVALFDAERADAAPLNSIIRNQDGDTV